MKDVSCGGPDDSQFAIIGTSKTYPTFVIIYDTRNPWEADLRVKHILSYDNFYDRIIQRKFILSYRYFVFKYDQEFLSNATYLQYIVATEGAHYLRLNLRSHSNRKHVNISCTTKGSLKKDGNSKGIYELTKSIQIESTPLIDFPSVDINFDYRLSIGKKRFIRFRRENTPRIFYLERSNRDGSLKQEGDLDNIDSSEENKYLIKINKFYFYTRIHYSNGSRIDSSDKSIVLFDRLVNQSIQITNGLIAIISKEFGTLLLYENKTVELMITKTVENGQTMTIQIRLEEEVDYMRLEEDKHNIFAYLIVNKLDQGLSGVQYLKVVQFSKSDSLEKITKIVESSRAQVTSSISYTAYRLTKSYKKIVAKECSEKSLQDESNIVILALIGENLQDLLMISFNKERNVFEGVFENTMSYTYSDISPRCYDSIVFMPITNDKNDDLTVMSFSVSESSIKLLGEYDKPGLVKKNFYPTHLTCKIDPSSKVSDLPTITMFCLISGNNPLVYAEVLFKVKMIKKHPSEMIVGSPTITECPNLGGFIVKNVNSAIGGYIVLIGYKVYEIGQWNRSYYAVIYENRHGSRSVFSTTALSKISEQNPWHLSLLTSFHIEKSNEMMITRFEKIQQNSDIFTNAITSKQLIPNIRKYKQSQIKKYTLSPLGISFKDEENVDLSKYMLVMYNFNQKQILNISLNILFDNSDPVTSNPGDLLVLNLVKITMLVALLIFISSLVAFTWMTYGSNDKEKIRQELLERQKKKNIKNNGRFSQLASVDSLNYEKKNEIVEML